MARVVVIGAGAMGLAAAYRAARNGHSVDVVEAAPEPGGMAGHFDFDGLSLERYYHFVCKTDEPTFALLRELGLSDKLHWRETTMGLFDGALHPWGNPVALFRYPGLSLWNKLRYGLFAFVCVRKNSWEAIEAESARKWLLRWCGPEVEALLWEPLLRYKFYEFADNVSSTWIWTRIRRIGRSRKSLMQEELGYLEGGSLTLVEALVQGIQAHGGRVHLTAAAQKVTTESGRVSGVLTGAGFFPADAVISTAPTPLVSALVPDLPEEWKAKYNAIHNIGVCCLVFKLKRSVSPHFWVNIIEEGIEIPGVIEFSNLRPTEPDTIVYVPYYMPVTHPKWQWTDEQLLAEAWACLCRINPALRESDVKASKVARLKHGQPICEPNFCSRLPAVQTPIAGLQVADTCFYYPEDRGIAESVRLGQHMADAVPAPSR